MLGFPSSSGYAWCKGGAHLCALSDLTSREGGRYCAAHLPPEPDPEPEPGDEPVPADHETEAVLAARVRRWPRKHRAALDFQRWRYLNGYVDGDDYPEA